jgi:hypothetical protein
MLGVGQFSMPMVGQFSMPVDTIANRSGVEELSQPIRRMYTDWLAPTSSTVVAYQSRKLYVFCGSKYLRYDFVKGRWTRGTVAHTMLHGLCFRDPGSAVQNMCFLDSARNIYRWQPADVVGSNAATTDAGTAIPAWIYMTGFDFTSKKTRIRSIFLDCTGPVALSAHVSMEDVDGRVKEFRKMEHQENLWADLSAYKFRLKLVGVGGAQVRRLMWERTGLDQEGA